MPGHVPVREIALLRDALINARAQDGAARDSLEVKAQEFETLFNSSPVGMAFAQDPGLQRDLHNTAMDELIGPRGSHQAGTVRVLHRGPRTGARPSSRCSAPRRWVRR